jgi:uncharacterized protein (TIGR02996 family)
MSDRAGILRAIVENPDDITHRLVYADWLDDHGQSPLAAFIRAQCALRPFLLDPELTPSPRRWVGRFPVAVEVMQVQPDLRPGLLEAFLPLYETLGEFLPLHEILGDPRVSVLTEFFSFWIHRGFVEDVEIYGEKGLTAFLNHAETIVERTPLLRLTLSMAASREAHANGAPYYGSGSEDTDAVSLETIGELLNTPKVERLRHLDLRDLRLGDDLGRTLLNAPSLPGLQRFLLDGNEIREEMTEQLRQQFGSVLVLRPYDPDNDIPF